tara:strand:+ start:35 stop:415 length:381 start_codon:yes stop_codon:yes gene_type:complete
MRVKITKTIDVNDIAGETRKILDTIKNKIVYGMPDEMSEIVRMSLSSNGDEYFQTIELIENFRKNLTALDENLSEVQNIIQGYKDVVMPSPPEQPDEDTGINDQAEYEKFMSRVADLEEEEFDEEG